MKNNKEKHEKAFEKWSVSHWGINVDPSEVEKMIWLAACEYMSVQHGKLFSYRQMEKKLDAAIEALTELGHYGIDFGHGKYYCDVAKVAQEAIKQIKEQE